MANTAKKKSIKLTTEQVKELKALAEAAQKAAEAKKIRERFKAFMEDNEDALRAGITTDGLKLGIHYSKQLTVELV